MRTAGCTSPVAEKTSVGRAGSLVRIVAGFSYLPPFSFVSPVEWILVCSLGGTTLLLPVGTPFSVWKPATVQEQGGASSVRISSPSPSFLITQSFAKVVFCAFTPNWYVKSPSTTALGVLPSLERLA